MSKPKRRRRWTADQKWQTDIKYVRVGARNYYLLSFMDLESTEF